MSKLVEQKLVSHMESDERDFGYLKETMTRIEASQNKAETNHWAHVQASTGAMEEDIKELKKALTDLLDLFSEHKVEFSEQKTNIVWVMRFFWVVATAAVGSIITGLLPFVVK